jgi:Amidohydrolase
MMTELPSRIVDMHAHFFNARCLPLAGIFANAIGKDAGDSPMARSLARLVNFLTESQYLPHPLDTREQGEDYYIERLCIITAAEWGSPSQLNRDSSLTEQPPKVSRQQSLRDDLEQIVRGVNTALPELGEVAEPETLESQAMFGDWAKRVVKKALKAFLKVALPHEVGNYVEFVFNMLTAEEEMVATLIHGYKQGLPPLEFVHHMMDMQMAYVTKGTSADEVAPAYPFSQQLKRMKKLADEYSQVRGFSAFDPRRPEWEALANVAIQSQFVGFKFYPAMGYLPYEDKDAVVRERIYAFFDFCIARDVPIFTHCTPRGFETRLKEGLNADPRGWEHLLGSQNGRFAKLRLCFGHGGGNAMAGGNEHDGCLSSPGWTADDKEWGRTENFARTVVKLCRTYENVYCDLAYFTQLFHDGSASDQAAALQRFAANLGRELNESGAKYAFSQKVCFGTDWHMPSIVEQPRRYLDIFLKLFSQPEFANHRQRFFWQNAYAFMNIDL